MRRGPRRVGVAFVSFGALSVAAVALHACKARQASAELKADEAQAEGGDGRATIATKKATCPFIGSAVATGALPADANNGRPLAAIDRVVALGDTGEGSDLGSKVLKVFATGNHAFMPGSSGRLDAPVPTGTFSLDFPGSKGSHPGHSGILQGDPTALDTGRFDEQAFGRLLAYAKDGHIARSDVGRFIGDNLARDPNAKVFGPRVTELLGADVLGFARQLGPTILERFRNATGASDETAEHRRLFTALTTITGEDNLIGSAGEFGLLFAFLAESPGTAQIRGEPALSVADLTQMFKDKRLPDGWERWKKTSHEWVRSTTGLLHAAAVRYVALRHPRTAGLLSRLHARSWMYMKTSWSHVDAWEYIQYLTCKVDGDWTNISQIWVQYDDSMRTAKLGYSSSRFGPDRNSETVSVDASILSPYLDLIGGTVARPPSGSGHDAYADEPNAVEGFAMSVLESSFMGTASAVTNCQMVRDPHEG